jgi:hypothetical protein
MPRTAASPRRREPSQDGAPSIPEQRAEIYPRVRAAARPAAASDRRVSPWPASASLRSSAHLREVAAGATHFRPAPMSRPAPAFSFAHRRGPRLESLSAPAPASRIWHRSCAGRGPRALSYSIKVFRSVRTKVVDSPDQPHYNRAGSHWAHASCDTIGRGGERRMSPEPLRRRISDHPGCQCDRRCRVASHPPSGEGTLLVQPRSRLLHPLTCGAVTRCPTGQLGVRARRWPRPAEGLARALGSCGCR